MEASQKTNRLLFLEVAKLGFLLGGIALLAPYGLRIASGAIGVSFGLTAIGGVAMVVHEGVSPWRLLKGFLQPIAACAVMAAAVWGTHHGLHVLDVGHPVIYLLSEIVIGAIAYVIAALVICRATSKDLLGLLKQALKRE
jgi:hypothetical protein